MSSLGGQMDGPSADASGPFDSVLNTALSEAFGQPLDGLSAKLGDKSNDAIGAVASTQGKQLSFGPGIDITKLNDAETMDTVAHEVSHGLANGGSGDTLLDRAGDPGEQVANQAGSAFGSWMAGGMKGSAPKLKPAVGGKAAIHRKAKKKPGSDGSDDDIDWVPFKYANRTKSEIKDVDTTGFDPGNTATVAAADGVTPKKLYSSRRTDTFREVIGGGVGPLSAEDGSMAKTTIEAFSTDPKKRDPQGKVGWLDASGKPMPGSATTIEKEFGLNGNLYDGEGIRFRKEDAQDEGGQLFAGYTGSKGTHREMSLFRKDLDTYSLALREGTHNRETPGVNAGPVGAKWDVDTSTGRTDRFSLDDKTVKPETLAAVKEFWDTGLMPGSRRLSEVGTEEERAANTKRLADFDALNAKERELNARLADPKLSGAERDKLLAERGGLREKLGAARTEIRGQWDRHIGGPGKEVMPGLTHDLSLHSGTQTDEKSVSLGIKKTPFTVDFDVSSNKTTTANGWYEKPDGGVGTVNERTEGPGKYDAGIGGGDALPRLKKGSR